MLHLDGYSGLEPVHRGNRSFVLRAVRTGDGATVVIKTPIADFPSSTDLRRLRQEFEVGRAAEQGPAGAHVIRHLALEPVGASLALVLEHFAGPSLAGLARGAALPLSTFLDLGVAAARAVQAVHDGALVHCDINPSNILYDAESGHLRLCDFSTATRLGAGSVEEGPFRGTPAYMSPEQTRRTGWAVDHRSDLYSLGVTLFEVLTGRLPFRGGDMLETVHLHLAAAPPSPRDCRPDVPPVLAEILLKLLSKNPDERYQSAAGLGADLTRCRAAMAKSTTIEPFELASEDKSPRLSLPRRLYGREGELAQLTTALERAREGKSEFVTVAGDPGVGKSALVEQLKEQVHARKGHFCAGKFEPLHYNVPYSAFSSALRAFLRAVLARPVAELGQWRERVVTALGANGQLLVRLVPELERLVGPQPEVPPLEPEQAQARFRLLVVNLIRAISGPDAPLAIFLDDLQWADPASLSMIEQLVVVEGLGHLLLIGAYRQAEVGPEHPLSILLGKIIAVHRPVEIALRPLELPDVERIVADSVREDVEACRPLSRLVLQRTRGNPFFVGQFLKMLETEHLLWFDSSLNAWRWNLEGCEAQTMTANVADLMALRIHRLGVSSQDALRHASCIGSEFGIDTLSVLLGVDELGVQATLAEALHEHLIVRVSVETTTPRRDGEGSRFRFVHDHVQQAAYALIPEPERPSRHLTIGRALFRAYPPEERTERVFELLDHFGRGLHLIELSGEKVEIAALCLAAGRRAKSANAYEAATRYLRLGLDLLGKEGFEEAHDTTLALHRENAESCYLSGDLVEMERSCQQIKEHARNLLDRVSAYQLEIIAHVARNEMTQAVEVARDVLSKLGVNLPRRAGQTTAMVRVALAAWRMRRETPETLLGRPRMQDARALAATHTLALVMTPAYLTAPKLFPLVICDMLRLTLKHGNSEWSADALLGWSAIQIAAFGAIRRGYEVGSTAPRMIERLGALPRRGRIQANYNLLVRHWLEPLRSTIEPLRNAIQYSLEHGDLAFASVAAVTAGFYMFAAGHPLSEVEETALAHDALLRRLGQERFRRDALRHIQLVRCFQGRAPEPKRLRGEFFDEEEALRASQEAGDHAAIAALSYEKALLLYVYGDPKAALQCCRLAAEHVEGLLGTVYPPLIDFLAALVRVRVLVSEPSAKSRAGEIALVRASLRRLERWAKSGPSNQQHRVHLVRAELAHFSGNHSVASKEYEQAIDLAGGHGYTHERAMALECAGRFYVALGQERIAADTLLAARDAWAGWGAASKAAALEGEFSVLWTPRRSLPARSMRLPRSGDAGLGALDVDSIMKASQAIVSEIRLPNLVRRLIALAMENTGAQRGFLLLKTDGQLWIEAAADVDDTEGLSAIGSLRLSAATELLPVSIVEYVARVADLVLQSDVGTDPVFADDPYIVARHPLSVLCAPLVAQGKLSGVVYLENNRMRGAFTGDRVELLRLLSTQAAISVENARLYEDVTKAHSLQVRLSTAQARFVPAEFLKSLNRESIVEVALGDNIHKEMSILFSDVRGFTPLIESMSPQDHIGFINGYLGHMEPPILENGGFVDSYVGDAIMALFEGDADNALQAAIGMSSSLARFNREREHAGHRPIHMGVGISTGPLTLGTIGGPMRIKCGVIGDPVNLASRIESMTKHLSCFLLISHHTKERLRAPERFELRRVDRLRVKGKTAPVTLYEVLDAEPPLRREAKRRSLPRFQEAMAAYEAGRFREAERLLIDCLVTYSDDGAAASLLARARRHHREAPPSWDGIDTLDEK